LKEIVLVGNDKEESIVLKHLHNSSKFKVKKARTLEKAEKIIASINPDFVLCAGKINIDEEGNYVLEID
jgi:DNA-binding response OmpR family regulator